jgi:uroporphyrinogen III methyltransferase/synthase
MSEAMTETGAKSGHGSRAEAPQPPRVVVTRAEADDGPLSSQLRSFGLSVLLWPAVTVAQATPGPLGAALAQVDSFDWMVFASRHAVVAVTQILPVAPAGVAIAAVGQATAQVLQRRGWSVELIPPEANATALVEAFAHRGVDLRGARILFPASSRALPTIAKGLTQLGAEVVQVEAYRTESSQTLDVADCREWIARGGIGAVTFTSPSAVDELAQALGPEDFNRLLTAATAVAIGPTTAQALTQRGHTPVMAASATLQSLAHTTYRSMQRSGAVAR